VAPEIDGLNVVTSYRQGTKCVRNIINNLPSVKWRTITLPHCKSI